MQNSRCLELFSHLLRYRPSAFCLSCTFERTKLHGLHQLLVGSPLTLCTHCASLNCSDGAAEVFGVQKLLDSPGPIFGSSIFNSLQNHGSGRSTPDTLRHHRSTTFASWDMGYLEICTWYVVMAGQSKITLLTACPGGRSQRQRFDACALPVQDAFDHPGAPCILGRRRMMIVEDTSYTLACPASMVQMKSAHCDAFWAC